MQKERDLLPVSYVISKDCKKTGYDFKKWCWDMYGWDIMGEKKRWIYNLEGFTIQLFFWQFSLHVKQYSIGICWAGIIGEVYEE